MSELDALTPEQKRALLARLLARPEQQPEERSYPMSFSQQRLWFLDQLSPGNPFYNVEAAIPIPGPLDADALRRAVNGIIARHEVLRTTFRMVNGEPAQVVAPRLEIDIPVVDLRHLPPAERDRAVALRRVEEATRSFDLAQGPLIRAVLLRLADAQHLFLLGMHHIVSDGWSMGIFGREMGAFYTAYVTRREPDLPPLPIQYGDFAAWQQKHLSGERLEEQLGYWRGQLEGLAPLELPTDHPRPPVQTFRGAYHNLSLPDGLARDVNRLSRQEGVTLFMTLLAAFKLLLHRYSDQEDVVVGTYIANRNRAETEGLIGFFLNTLVLRTRVEDGLTVRELLHRVREVALGAYDHQDLPFEKLVEHVQPERDLSRNPLFQVTFQVTNAPTQQRVDDPGAALDSKRGTAIFDIAFMLFETTRGISGQFEYSTELFDAATIERMAGHFQALLQAMVDDPSRLVSQLPMLTPAERRHLVHGLNDTARPLSESTGLVEMFQAQAARTPDAVAFTCDGRALSFAELERRANQVAHHLADAGVAPGTVVALCLERSLDAVAALLGIYKAGGVYLPLDPAYPAERLAYMLEDSRAAVLLTDGARRGLFPDFAGRTVVLDAEREAIAARPVSAPGVRISADAPAYLIYTSGSTGRPKGIVAPHRQVLNRLAWMWREYPFAAGEVSCHKTALSFVDSLWELFGPLLRGVPSVIVPDAAVRDPQALVREMAQNRVTRLWLVPSLLGVLLDHFPDLRQRLPDLTFWVSSGEALSPELLRRFERAMPHAVLFNLYGTSEVWDATWYDPRPGGQALRRVPIGRPIDNVRTYVLDRNRQPVPIGVPGELYVAGMGVCDGYLHRPELTAESFVQLALRDGAPETAYRTGDRARVLADGNLEYLGRRDHQLKVRGYRVEPAEIESVLSTHPALLGAAVVADAEGRLTAAVVPAAEPAPSTEELRRFLLGRLPPYMVPAAFVPMAELPLTPSGKVDRVALARRTPVRTALAQPYVEPAPGVETELAAIWAQVLRVERVGAQDNFFDLGGHSLLATQIISRVNALFSVDVPLRQLFETPTVAGMALALEQARGGDEPAAPRAPTITRLRREAYLVDVPG